MKYLNFLLGLALMMVSISAVAAPSYQMPFACNETWRLATFDYHNPLRAVDMNRDGDFGDSVVASAAGTVSVRRDLGDTSYGRYLVIDHGNDYNTLYAHLSAFDVSIGQSVRKGQRIGYVGSTGTSSPHLHYEQRIGGTAKPVVFNGVAVPYYTAGYWTSKNSCGDGSGVSGVVNTSGEALNVRSGPGTSYSIVGHVSDGATVTIICQMPGTTVTGTYGTSKIWDKIGSGRFVSDAYVRTGSDGYVAPRCT